MKCKLKTEILFGIGRKHFGKRRKWWSLKVIKSHDCVERVNMDYKCRLQMKCKLKTEILFGIGRKHFGKRRKWWSLKVIKSHDCVERVNMD